MANTIKLKRGSGSNPGTSDLSVGELAIRTDTAKLFTKNDAGNVSEIGGDLTSLNASNLTSGTVAAARLDTATTQSAGNNSTKIATTAYADTAISNLVDSSPSALNTLNELAAALGDDANFSTTVTNSIATKMPLAGGTFTGDTVWDNPTNTGKDWKWNSGSNQIELNDQVKLVFGDGSDLKIEHDSGNSFITDSGTGKLIVKSDNQIELVSTSNYSMIEAIVGGEVKLFHNGTWKAKTVSGGFTVDGTCTATTFSGSGASLTTLNASNLSSGTVATARLGSGTASSSVFLRGDGSWASAGGTSTGETYVKLKSDGSASNSGTSTYAGYQAANNNGGDYNVAIGHQAFYSADTGAEQNVVIGYQAGYTLTGDKNVAIGDQSLRAAVEKSECVAIGFDALKACNVSYNTGIGASAASRLTTGESTVAIGAMTLGYDSGADVTGDKNTAVGCLAMSRITTGFKNTAIGEQAGLLITEGFMNTCLGVEAGANITTGDRNIVIGAGASASSATVDEEITLGDSNITKFRIPGLNFVVKDSTATDNYVLTVDSNGEAGWEAIVAGGIGSESSSKRYVIIGPQAGEDIGGDGEDNVFIGYQAGKEQNGNGVKNVLIGSYAGQAQTTAQGSVAIGYKSLFTNETYGQNVAIGYEAQYTSTTSYNCVSVGKEAHYNLTSGDGNTAIGPQAMYNLTTGMDNVAVGMSAGRLWGTDSSDNVAIGYGAFGQAGYTGAITNSVAVGYDALYACRTGIENTGIGSRVLNSVVAGKWNTALGFHAGGHIVNADKNVCIGFEAGHNLTTAENNICIGYKADPENATDDNRVVIGNSDIVSFEVPGINFKVLDSTASNDYILKIAGGGGATWQQDLGAIAYTWGNHNSGSYASYSHTHNTFLTSNAADSADYDITFRGGPGAVTISSNDGSDIRFENSTLGSVATGMASLRMKDQFFLIQGGENGTRFLTEDGTSRWWMTSSGKLQPEADATYDIGTEYRKVKTIWAEEYKGPVGKVLQYAYDIKTDTFTTTSTSWVDIPGLITPALSATSATTLMVVTVSLGKVHNHEGSIGCRIIRRSYSGQSGWTETVIGVGDSAGNRPQITFNAYGKAIYNANHAGSYSFTFTDDHNTEFGYYHYKVQIQGESSSGSGTMVNRSYDDSNESHIFRGRSISHICVMEVAT